MSNDFTITLDIDDPRAAQIARILWSDSEPVRVTVTPEQKADIMRDCAPSPADLAPEPEQAAPPPPTSEPESDDTPARDSEGIPWDARIHAESKALTANGTWRAKRKPKDMEADQWRNYVDSVKAELRAALAAPTPEPVASSTPPPPTSEPDSGEQAAPPPPTDESEITDGGALMRFYTANMSHLSKEDFTQACEEVGAGSIQTLLSARQDLIPAVAAKLRAIVAEKS